MEVTLKYIPDLILSSLRSPFKNESDPLDSVVSHLFMKGYYQEL